MQPEKTTLGQFQEYAMIVILGLVLLIAAVVIGVAAVVTNMGSAHELTAAFKVFGYEMTGSTGMLFLFGAIVGAVAVLGLSLLLGGVRRTSRRKHAVRHKESRRDAAAPRTEQGDRIDYRDQSDLGTAEQQENASPRRDRSNGDGRRHKRHLFGHRPAHR
ncbi:hypothetical protein DY245_29550 [Streptomyces inhibens]|uniref:LapA family protein n=1 Tax=Streptomyces inhibens TaxID=2293571 RepID=A0A371PWZ3_STRIH|nr:hypothetical protein [Streptomyces inhibens]REK86948.1 hypothetical protein DY245_29550 [Streptomyces inhibens]